MKKKKPATRGAKTVASNYTIPRGGISAFDALELITVEAIKLESLAGACNDAIDHYGVPTAVSTRNYDRLQALVSATFDGASGFSQWVRKLIRGVQRYQKATNAPSPHVARARAHGRANS